MYCVALILRSFRSGERVGLWPSFEGGVYVNVSSLSFRQPLAADFDMEVNDGIVILAFMLYCCCVVVFLRDLLGWG